MDDLTPGQRRTQRAREARTQNKLNRMAAELTAAGFLVVHPDANTEKVRRLISIEHAVAGAGRG